MDELKNKRIKLFGKKISSLDFFAALLFLILFFWLFFSLQYGVNVADESCYYTIVQRMKNGDRLFIDEWQITQLSSFLQIIPFQIFVSITGGTDGIILFFRYLFFVIQMILYWYLYVKYRTYGLFGVFGCFLFCMTVTGDIFSVFYGTAAAHGIVVVCSILFLSEKSHSPWILVFCGLVFACTVLAEPLFSLLYFIYTSIVVITFVKRKKTPFRTFDLKSWGFLTAGVIIVAIPIYGYLVFKSGVRLLVDFIPEILSDSKYDLLQHIQRIFTKSNAQFHYFGIENAIIWICLFCFAALYCVKRNQIRNTEKNRKRIKPRYRSERKYLIVKMLIVAGALLCMILSYIHGMVRFAENQVQPSRFLLYDYYFYHFEPFLLFCFLCYLLTEKKDISAFGFLCVSAVACIIRAYSSLIDVSAFGVICFPSGLIVIRDLFQEVNAFKQKSCIVKKNDILLKRALTVLMSVCLLSFLCFEGVGWYVERFFQPIERYHMQSDAPLDCQLSRGPLKGIYTIEPVQSKYDRFLIDMDFIKRHFEGPVVIYGNAPYLYLYLDMPYGVYSADYTEDDFLAREHRYLELLPERTPQVIYVPFYETNTYRKVEDIDKKLQTIKEHFRCKVLTGSMGYIVRIEG